MEFDDAKENIQPLAAGRNASILQASLRVESIQELQAQRQELEQAIHNYQGDDPLEVWYDYITWIEQSYPSGGKESGLEEVLSKCLSRFEGEKKYNQDRRMIKLYIKFIEMHKDPTECYQQLYNEGIGTMVADLYMCWAYCYDLSGNYRKADEIFRRGLACRAQPLEDLQEAHQHFGFTVSQRLLYKDDENATEIANRQLHERRMALTSLRTHRKKVGSIRTGAAVKSYVPGTLKTDTPSTSSRASNVKVMVFKDENESPNVPSIATSSSSTTSRVDSGDDASKKSVVRTIIDAARNQENQKEPGPWNKAHDKKKGKLFGRTPSTDIGFNILEDESNKETVDIAIQENVVKSAEIIIDKPFKLFPNFKSKNRPLPDWPTPVTIENESQPRVYPQYNKCKLYPRPNMEFQLEELRAYNWFCKRGIENKFTQERDAVWKSNKIDQVRQYPNFAKKSRPQNIEKLDNFFVPERNANLMVYFDEIYNLEEKEEFQFEEILLKRWQKGDRKLRYDMNDTIVMPTEMEETICVPHDVEPTNRRKSFFPARKSIAPSSRISILPKNTRHYPQIEETGNEDVSTEKIEIEKEKSTLPSDLVDSKHRDSNEDEDQKLRQSLANFKIYDEAEQPSTSAAANSLPKTFEIYQEAEPFKAPPPVTQAVTLYQDSFEFKTPAVPVTIKNKIPFEIFEETTIDKSNAPPNNIPENVGFDADETCSTQFFNCFIKAQSVSTPVSVKRSFSNRVLAEKTEAEPVAHVSPKPMVTNANSDVEMPAQSEVTYSPPLHKQLSTILETSEHGTTKSTMSSPEFDLDPKGTAGRLLSSQSHLESVKEHSHKSVPPNISKLNNMDNVVENATPLPPRLQSGGTNFSIFEDRTETDAVIKQVGNFSRIEEREDTASGYNVRPIKFQEDKTETISKIMMSSKQEIRFQDDKTDTMSKIFLAIPPSAKFLENKTDTLPKIPINPPTDLDDDDDSFKIFTQTPPKLFTNPVSIPKSKLNPSELLRFSENSPLPRESKIKCSYDTPELSRKVSILKKCDDSIKMSKIKPINADDSLLMLENFSMIQETKPKSRCTKETITKAVANNLKDSFIPDFSLIEETQAKSQDKPLKENEFSFIKDSQPQFESLSKCKKKLQVKKQATMKSFLQDSFDFSMVTDSQPTNIESKWKQNSKSTEHEVNKSTAEVDVHKHILTDSFMKDFSAIKEPPPGPPQTVLHKSSSDSTSGTSGQPSKLKFMTDVSLKESDRDKKGLIQDSQHPEQAIAAKKKDDIFSVSMKANDFYEDNAETAQFAPNMSMIRNSTLLPGKRLTQIQDKSLHIKPEPTSHENSFDTSYQIFKSPPITNVQPCNSVPPVVSKLSFLGLQSNSSTRFSIELSSEEIVAIQKAKKKQQDKEIFAVQNNTDVKEFKTPSNDVEKIVTNNVEEIVDDSDPELDEYCDMSIYHKQSPKTPKIQRHIWNSSEESNQDDAQFIHRDTDLNNTHHLIENICLDENVNPFNTDLINAFLDQIEFTNYIDDLPSCELIGKVSQVHKDSIVKVNDVEFKVLKIIGEGAYGVIYSAIETKTGNKYALKQEKPANYWEYYICLEVRSRLSVDEMMPAFMNIEYALIGKNASILLSRFSSYGSLINVCNKIKKVTMKNIDEYLVMLITCQILEIMDHLHSMEIIHADIKADNILLIEKLSYDLKRPSLQLIDFGVSIDMRLFKKGQQFTFSHKENSIKSVEMRENRPWTYQLDLFGVAGVIHALLFGKYMDIEKKANGLWMHKTNIPRYFNKSLWETIFKTLINIRDSSSMPNLQNLRAQLKEELAEKESHVIQKIFDFNRALDS